MRKWLARLIPGVLGTVLAVAVLETALATIALKPSPRREDSFYQPDPCVGWRHIPHKSEGKTVVGRVVLDQPINSQGFRDREYPQTKAPGTFRIVVLGDSFTDQLEIPTSQLYHEVLERKLNSAAIQPVEVINFGVAGFGTAQEYLTLKCCGLKYAPDLVMLAVFVGNDVFDNSIALHQRSLANSPRPFFQLENGTLKQIDQAPRGRHIGPVRRIALRLLPRSYESLSRGKRRLSQLLSSAQEKAVGGRGSRAGTATIEADYGVYQDPYTPGWDSAWAVTKALILNIAATLDRSKVSFLVVVIPNEYEFRPDRWQLILDDNPEMRASRFDLGKPERILSEFFQENRINYLLLRPAFEKQTKHTREDLHFHRPGDNHWNADGHALAASEIFVRLVWGGLVKVTGAP